MSTHDLFGDTIARRRAMGSHQSQVGGKDEWLTPPELIRELGPFDLDPCAPIRRPWDTATEHYTIQDDGLNQRWHGFVWCNPPYAHVGKWMARMAEHGNGIALLFARTETKAWHEHIWPKASSVLFLKGRLTFYHVDGTPGASNSGAPSALIGYGMGAARRLSRAANSLGKCVRLEVSE